MSPYVKWGTRYPLKAARGAPAVCQAGCSNAQDPAGDKRDGLAWRSDQRVLVTRTPTPPQPAQGSGVGPDLGREGRGMEAG